MREFLQTLLLLPGRQPQIEKSLKLHGDISTLKNWGVLKAETQCIDNGSLFPRIIVDKEKGNNNPKQQKSKDKDMGKEKNALPTGLISIDDFFTAKLKTAKILEAEKVEGTTKLLKLQIDIGNEKRQIVAGIAESYQAEDLIGKTIITVTNLKPATIRGIESQGMLLAAKNKKTLTLITVDSETPPGLSVG